jgi:hypothetical protein
MSIEPTSHPPDVDSSLFRLHVSVLLSVEEVVMNPWREPSRNDIQPSSSHETADHLVEVPDLPTFPSSAFDATSHP